MTSRLAAAIVLVLLSSCSATHVVRLDTGQGAPREYKLPTWNKSVGVGALEFERALTQLVMETPLTTRSPQPGWLVRASYPGDDVEPHWKHLTRKSLGGICKPGFRRDDCLSLLDDVMGLSEWDKLGVALGLSFDPLRESMAQAVQDTLAPQLFYSVIATGLVTWVVLAANPEPVFTKAAAIVSAVMLIYLGVDAFLAVVNASLELKRATDRATTFEELQQASQRFGHTVGPEISRVFVLAVTVAVSHGMTGGAALLASRVSMLPRFSEATTLGASRVGLDLAAVGHVSAVAVVEGNLVITLAPTAVAMAAQSQEGGATAGINAAAFKSWGSFSGLKSALGSAGQGKNWHHIVEQTKGNVQRFGPHAIHNTENVIPLEQFLHTRVSAFYSSIRERITGSTSLTVRQWLSTQSYESQRQFGLKAIEKIRTGEWQ